MRLPSSWTKHAMLPVAACVASLYAWLLASFSLSLLAVALLIISAMLSTRRRPAIALVVVSTLLAVAAADLLVGVLLPPRSEPLMMDPTSDYADKRYHNNDSDLGFQPRPGVHTSRKLVTDTGEVIYDVVYTIGDDGFRAMPEAVGKSPQVNLFGGSFAFGEGLNDDETLAHYLQESLRVGVKSYAVHGYGMHQALAILQRPAPPTGRLNIFLTIPWHALRSACRPAWCAHTPRYVIEAGRLRRDGACPLPTEPSGALGTFVAQSNIYRAIDDLRRHPGAMKAADIELYLAIMREAYRLSSARGQQVMIGFIKAESRSLRGSGWTNRQIADALAKHSDYFLDLTLAERPEALTPKLYLHPLDRHPSALANALRARRIARALSDSGFAPAVRLPPDSPAQIDNASLLDTMREMSVFASRFATTAWPSPR